MLQCAAHNSDRPNKNYLGIHVRGLIVGLEIVAEKGNEKGGNNKRDITFMAPH